MIENYNSNDFIDKWNNSKYHHFPDTYADIEKRFNELYFDKLYKSYSKCKDLKDKRYFERFDYGKKFNRYLRMYFDVDIMNDRPKKNDKITLDVLADRLASHNPKEDCSQKCQGRMVCENKSNYYPECIMSETYNCIFRLHPSIMGEDRTICFYDECKKSGMLDKIYKSDKK